MNPKACVTGAMRRAGDACRYAVRQPLARGVPCFPDYPDTPLPARHDSVLLLSPLWP